VDWIHVSQDRGRCLAFVHGNESSGSYVRI
jgi:hypothetical protein